MDKVAEWFEFLTGCLNAIAKGLNTCRDHWPNHNPFTDATKAGSNGVGK